MIVVTGLPRSGTSMMMKMLEAGGLKAIYDEKKGPTNANPNGFYEYGGMEHKPEWWVDEGGGDCIKALIPQVKSLGDRKVKYIFMTRDMKEIADSFNKMHRADIWAMGHLRWDVQKLLKDKDVVFIDYNAVIENPEHELKKIKDLIPNFDEALKVVDKKLYRTKNDGCGGKLLSKEKLQEVIKFHEARIKDIQEYIKELDNVNNIKKVAM